MADPFSAHEVLDRAWLLQNTFEAFICGHPFVTETPELLAAAESVNEKLAEFYQLAGKYALDQE